MPLYARHHNQLLRPWRRRSVRLQIASPGNHRCKSLLGERHVLSIRLCDLAPQRFIDFKLILVLSKPIRSKNWDSPRPERYSTSINLCHFGLSVGVASNGRCWLKSGSDRFAIMWKHVDSQILRWFRNRRCCFMKEVTICVETCDFLHMTQNYSLAILII